MYLDGDSKALRAYHSGIGLAWSLSRTSSGRGYIFYWLRPPKPGTHDRFLRSSENGEGRCVKRCTQNSGRRCLSGGSAHSSFLICSDRVCSKGGWRPNVGRHKGARYTGDLLEPGPRVPFAQFRSKRLASAQHLRRYPVRCGSGPPALIGRTNSRDSPTPRRIVPSKPCRVTIRV